MRILIRSDASIAMGSGHVMRCRNLARALRRRGAEVWFLCREQPGDLIPMLEGEFVVLRLATLPDTLLCPEDRKGHTIYETWLGCSPLQDAADCLEAVRRESTGGVDWVVVDHYGLDHTWEEAFCAGLRGVGCDTEPQLLVFDDLANRMHRAEVLVDANRLAASATGPYDSLVPGHCRLLLGPTYAPLDPLYGHLQPLAPQRRELQRVLVFFGGTDQANHTATALHALSAGSHDQLVVDVVLGRSAPHLAAIKQQVQRRAHTQLHCGLPNLAGLMMRADLAIGAAGTASWERAALGLPAIITPVADNQRQGAEAIAKAGAAILVGWPTAEDAMEHLVASIQGCIQNPDLLPLLSDRARNLGDGRGLDRIVTTMLGPGAERRCRPASIQDENLYHAWANEPEVRRQSFQTDPIPLAEHQRWFRDRLHSANALLQVFVDGEGLPLGQVRFERTDPEPWTCVVGFSLDPVARGHGLASELLTCGLRELTRHWGVTQEVYAEVKVSNAASAKALQTAGFTESAAPRPGVRCFRKPVATTV